MNKKSALSSGLKVFLGILLVLVLTLPAQIIISLGERVYRDYSLEKAEIRIELKEDASAIISEIIHYDFRGCFKEVYRNAYFIFNRKFSLASISGYCEPECETRKTHQEFVGYFGQVCNREARFFINMQFDNTIKRGEDVNEFHYKVWGSQWDRKLKTLNAEILLPENAEIIEIYFNPEDSVKDYTAKDNSIQFSAESLRNFLEVRILMTPESFNIGHNEDTSLGIIRKEQEEYKKNYKKFFLIFILSIITISFLAVLVPLLLYRKYGREIEQVDREFYEREPLKGIKPYLANFVAVSYSGKKIGKSDINSVLATLLDLVRMKYISIEQVMHNKGGNKKKDFKLSFVGKDTSVLRKPEQLVYSFFKGFSEDSALYWSEFRKIIAKRENAKKIYELIESFDKEIKAEINIKDYFDNKGNFIFKAFCLASFIIFWVIILFITQSGSNLKGLYPFIDFLFPFSLAILVLSLIGFILPCYIFGRFSEKGFQIFKNMTGYKNFLTNLTLLKEYPPHSIVIWEEHLVFATALGVAKEVSKKLDIVVPESLKRQSSLYFASKYNFARSFNSAYYKASSSSRSSRGGVGGGFGGAGGGGAR